jgi:hypothetical protein
MNRLAVLRQPPAVVSTNGSRADDGDHRVPGQGNVGAAV